MVAMPAAAAVTAAEAEAAVIALAQPRAPRSSVPAAANKQRFPSSLAEIVQSSVAIASKPKRAVRAAVPADAVAAAVATNLQL